MAIYDPIVDLFSQERVNAPNIDESAADLGRNPDYAVGANSALARRGDQTLSNRQQQSNVFESQGAAGLGAMQGRAGAADAAGQAGQVQGQVRGTMLDRTGMDMGAGARAQAGALQSDAAAAQSRNAPNVNLAAANQSAATGTQAQGALFGNANALSAASRNNQAQAATAGALGANAGALGANAGALGRAAQTPQAQQANAQALGAAGTTGAGQQNNAQAFRDFYTRGPGASAAEAQLRMGSERAQAANLAMARSGRGGANAGAERQALFANAAAQQNLNQQQGLLRAQEADMFRNRQLQAMGGETGALGTARGQDIQGLAAQTNALGQARGQDIQALMGQTGALGQATGALSAQGGLQTAARGQDIGALQGQTAALGQAGGLANQQQQIGAQTALGVSGQQLQQRGMNDAASIQREQLAQQALAQGNANQLAAMGLGNQSIAQGQNFALGQGQLGNQAMATGLGYNAQMGGLSNQAYQQGVTSDLAYQGMGNQLLTNQANLDMNMEALKSGQMLQADMANAGYDQARDAGLAGMITSVFAASDVNAKTAISPIGADAQGVESDPYGLSGGGMSRPGVAPSPSAATTPTGPGGPAYDKAMGQQQAAATAEATSAESPKTAGIMDMAMGLLGSSPNIPTYQSPQWAPVDSNYVQSDERAKEEAEALGFDRGVATGRINAVNGLNAYEARGQLPQYLQYLREQAMEDMRKHGVARETDAAPEVKPAKKSAPAKPKRDPKTAAALGIRDDGETDLRPVQNFAYNYKNPNAPGAAPGRQVGPMAQDIARSDAAPLVSRQPNGMLGVDGARAGMVALGAAGEQQRRIDELEQRMAALGVRSAA